MRHRPKNAASDAAFWMLAAGAGSEAAGVACYRQECGWGTFMHPRQVQKPPGSPVNVHTHSWSWNAASSDKMLTKWDVSRESYRDSECAAGGPAVQR